MNLLKGVVSICHSFRSTGPGFSLELFLWESLGLLYPKVEGPKVKVGGPMVSIDLRRRFVGATRSIQGNCCPYH